MERVGQANNHEYRGAEFPTAPIDQKHSPSSDKYSPSYEGGVMLYLSTYHKIQIQSEMSF